MIQKETIIWHTLDERPKTCMFVLLHYKGSNEVFESFYYVGIDKFKDHPLRDSKYEDNIWAWAKKPKGWKHD